MKPTIRQQMFGDVNRQLNAIRRRWNREIADQYEQLLKGRQGNLTVVEVEE